MIHSFWSSLEKCDRWRWRYRWNTDRRETTRRRWRRRFSRSSEAAREDHVHRRLSVHHDEHRSVASNTSLSIVFFRRRNPKTKKYLKTIEFFSVPTRSRLSAVAIESLWKNKKQHLLRSKYHQYHPSTDKPSETRNES